MTTTYAASTKTARMNAVVTDIGTSGKLKLLTAADAILASATLAATAGTVSGDTLTLSDANGATAGILNTTASAAGKAAKAIITTSADATKISGWTVGLTSTAAPAWAVTTAYALNAKVTNGANQYIATTGGTSTTGGGPTGTGTGITDGTVVWNYYSPAGADVQMDSIEFNIGQAIQVNAATIQHAA